jgi:hypothetical protein
VADFGELGIDSQAQVEMLRLYVQEVSIRLICLPSLDMTPEHSVADYLGMGPLRISASRSGFFEFARAADFVGEGLLSGIPNPLLSA